MEKENKKNKTIAQTVYGIMDDLFYMIDLFARSFNTFFIWGMAILLFRFRGAIPNMIMLALMFSSIYKMVHAPYRAGAIARRSK